jgi:hypothetical protein
MASAETNNIQRSDKIECCIDRLLSRASIDLNQCPDWEMSEFDYRAGKIIIYKGCQEVLKEISVFPD